MQSMDVTFGGPWLCTLPGKLLGIVGQGLSDSKSSRAKAEYF
jgi:hypothetical protein